MVGLEVASATARSTWYAERSPSDRGLGLDLIDCLHTSLPKYKSFEPLTL